MARLLSCRLNGRDRSDAVADNILLLDYLREKMNVTLAEGQDQLKGKVIRIAHIGYMGAFDVITAIAALEMALRKFGAEIPFGRGVAAAQEVLMEALR